MSTNPTTYHTLYDNQTLYNPPGEFLPVFAEGGEISSLEQSQNSEQIRGWDIFQRLLPLQEVTETKDVIAGRQDVRPFVKDKQGNLWLADSGSTLTVVPPRPSDREDNDSNVTAANGGSA